MPLKVETARTGDEPVGSQKNVSAKGQSENSTHPDSSATVVRIARPFLSARRQAAILRSELRRLAIWRHQNGVLLDGEPWAFVLAAVLASAEEGPLLFPNRTGRAWWPGLTFPALQNEARICGISIDPDKLPGIVARAADWRARNPHRKLRGDTIARLLNVVGIERRSLKLTTIGAVDENKEQRVARRLEEGRASDRERKRLARGCQPRAEYLANALSRQKPWESEGISESTWRRRRRKGVDSDDARRDRGLSDPLIIDTVHGQTSVTCTKSEFEAVAPARNAPENVPAPFLASGRRNTAIGSVSEARPLGRVPTGLIRVAVHNPINARAIALAAQALRP